MGGEEFCLGVFRAEFGRIDDPTVIGDILSRLHIESARARSTNRDNNSLNILAIAALM
jgi:hypothetical protein